MMPSGSENEPMQIVADPKDIYPDLRFLPWRMIMMQLDTLSAKIDFVPDEYKVSKGWTPESQMH